MLFLQIFCLQMNMTGCYILACSMSHLAKFSYLQKLWPAKFFFQYREERFRQTSESTNQRVLWWSIAQTVILLITGFWQIRHLKGFFEAKKLV